jgi:hypothetical protein
MRKNLKSKLTLDSRQFTVKLLSTGLCQLSIVLLIAACSSTGGEASLDEYTCPMHPTVISDRPGACPVCGMELVRKGRAGEEVAITPELAQRLKSPAEKIVGEVPVVRAQFGRKEVERTLQGLVTYDTRRIHAVPARIGGRLENVHAKYNYQPVSRGSVLAEIYSPELAAAQREYLHLSGQPDDQRLRDAAKTKLLLLGFSEEEILVLERTKEVDNRFDIRSPVSGFLIGLSESVKPPLVASAEADMDAGTGGPVVEAPEVSPMTSTDGIVREGAYVGRGQTVFKLADVSALRLELLVPQELAVRAGTPVKVRMGDRQERSERVDRVQPFYTAGEPFQRVLVTVTDRDVRIGQWVEARVTLGSVEGLWIPEAAVLDLGDRAVVFLKKNESFAPVQVALGANADGWKQVHSGLTSGDEFAADAHYLVDSESFVRVKGK